MPSTLLIWLSLLAYLGASLALAVPDGPRSPALRRAALALAAIGALAHGALIFAVQRGGVDLHFFASLSLVGFGIAATTLVVNLFRPVAALGVIVFPLAAAALGIDIAFTKPHEVKPLEWQITLHAALALIGYSLLSIAALLAILLALQERALRHHRLGSRLIRALPPLTLTETLLFRLIGTGFVFLSLTLLSGVLFVDDLFAQHLAHKTVLSIVAWLIFGVLLIGRWRWGWRGQRAVRFTLAGMAILLLAWFGSQFVLELILKRKG